MGGIWNATHNWRAVVVVVIFRQWKRTRRKKLDNLWSMLQCPYHASESSLSCLLSSKEKRGKSEAHSFYIAEKMAVQETRGGPAWVSRRDDQGRHRFWVLTAFKRDKKGKAIRLGGGEYLMNWLKRSSSRVSHTVWLEATSFDHCLTLSQTKWNKQYTQSHTDSVTILVTDGWTFAVVNLQFQKQEERG